MTKDEIIQMAEEAFEADFQFMSNEPIERFAALVAAHEAEKWKAENKRDYENWKMAAEKAAECEREACAKVCDTVVKMMDGTVFPETCAAAIRARGNNK